MRDLGARGRDEVVEHGCGNVLVCRREAPERPLEMRPHDRVGPSQLAERREAENGRAPLALDLPQPLEHELQVRRFDPILVFLDATAAGSPDVDLTRGDLVEDHLHELGLDLDRFAGQLVVALNRPEDRGAAAVPVEVVEPEVVGEEVRDPALERIELREGVLAQPEEEVRAKARLADRCGKLVREFVPLVVEEVLLELIEDGVDISAHGFRGGGEPLGQTGARLDSHGGVDRLSEPVPGIAGPRRVEDDRGVRNPTKSRCDRCAEKRCLPHSARPVEHGQPGRE